MFDQIPVLMAVGAAIIGGLYLGKAVRLVGLPSLIGYMFFGVIMGASILGVFNEQAVSSLQFITDIALAMIALIIGSELNLKALARLGKGIIFVILSESLFAFILVTASLYLLTKDFALSIVFGALAPASAPAGTVAVIQENNARGNLTKALYAVVGFDDGLAIIIFGLSSAVAEKMLIAENSSAAANSIFSGLLHSVFEIILCVVVGGLLGLLYSLLVKKLKQLAEIPALTFGFVILATGTAVKFGFSLILTNMMLGFVLANTSTMLSVRKSISQLKNYMPLLFILFFFLAGAHLDISVLPSLGLLGAVYIMARTAGLMGGAWFGATTGKLESKIRKYLGMGILSQAGVAIGLSLVIQQKFSEIGSTHALHIASVVITTITATSIVFEIIGPLLTKYGLRKAGEIRDNSM